MSHRVFFSWQSDTPSKVGRNLIERALEMAVEQIAEDATVEEAVRTELSVDKDTTGVPGSPAIFDTILKKISSASVFVPDLTFSSKRLNGSPSPNPNVLIEYGWALSSPGLPRIIAVMNEAYGEATPAAMPFDLAHLRFPIRYSLREKAPDSERRQVRLKLAGDFAFALKTIFQSNEFNLRSETETPEFKMTPHTEVLERFRSSKERIGIPWVEMLGSQGSTIPVALDPGPSFWISLAPKELQRKKWSVVELRDAARRRPQFLMPPSRGNYGSYLRSSDVFSVWSQEYGNAQKALSLASAFTTGEVWGIDTLLLGFDQRTIFLAEIQERMEQCLSDYGMFLVELGVKPPFQWRAGFENVQGFRLALMSPSGHDNAYQNPVCLVDSSEAGGIYSPGDDPKVVLRSLFEDVCSASGKRLPDYAPYVITR